ncbi:MAG: hypothetical protein JXB05_17870 [Myxococcaceae bacterium]|nr:hypothetical protein [Myxococcaceae bacterium]
MDSEKQGREKFSGNTFRAYLNGLEAMGLRAVVRAMVPARVQRMMDHPPPATAWLEGDELPLLFNAVLKLQGLHGMRELGYAATSGTTGRFLKPLMQLTLTKHGRSPDALFSRLSSICRPFFQGLDFQFTPEGARAGVLQIRSSTPLSAASWAAWEGTLRILFDECGVSTGNISPSLLSEEGRLATLRVRW